MSSQSQRNVAKKNNGTKLPMLRACIGAGQMAISAGSATTVGGMGGIDTAVQ